MEPWSAKIRTDPEIKQSNPIECKMHSSLGVNTENKLHYSWINE